MALPNFNTASALTAFALEEMIQPFRKASGDVSGLGNTLGQLVGISALNSMLSPIFKGLNPANWFEKEQENFASYEDNEEESSKQSGEMQEAIRQGFFEQKSILEHIDETMKELLFVTESSMTKAAKERTAQERKKFLDMETDAEAKKSNEEQLKLLEEIAENSGESDEESKGMLSKLLGFVRGLFLFKTLTTMAGGIMGLLTIFKTSMMGLLKFAAIIPKLLFRLAGPAAAALNIFNTINNADDLQNEYGTKTQISAVLGNFLGGEREGGMDNAKSQATTMGMQGAALGMFWGPTGAIVGGIVGAIVGGISGYFGGERMSKFFDAFPAMFENIIETFSNGFQSIGDAISFLWNGAGTIIQNVIDGFMNGLNSIKDGAVWFYEQLVSVKDWIMNFDLFGSITSIFHDITDAISSLFTSLSDSISSYIFDMLSSMGVVGDRIAKNIFSDEEYNKLKGLTDEEIQPKENGITNLIKIVRESEIPEFSETKTKTKMMIQDFGSALWEGAKTAKEEAQEMIKQQTRMQMIPVPVPQPMMQPMQDSRPVLVAPRPIRNNNNPYNDMRFVE